MEIRRSLARVALRIRALVRGSALDRELEEELRFHVDELTAAYRARGLSPQAARRSALLAMGGMAQRKEECRDARGVQLLEHLGQDVRYAARTLLRAPAFTLSAAATLTLGISATVAMFTVVQGVLLRPLPFPEPGRLFLVALSPTSFFFAGRGGMADRTYLAFREHDRTFQHHAAFSSYKGTLTGTGDAAVVPLAGVTEDFFAVLGVPAAAGRVLRPGDGGPGRERTVVLSDPLWRTRFGSDPAILGRAVRIDGRDHTVVGIMPAGFDFPAKTAAWTPLVIEIDPGNSWLLPVVGRLKPELTPAQARAALRALAPTLPEGPPPDAADWAIDILPLKEMLVSEVRRPLQVFAAAVIIVLLIACANVANLLLARASARDREMALRAALGAAPGRLVRQLLTESALLAAIGGAAGVLVASWAVPMLLALAPAGRIPRLDAIRIDAGVLAFAVVVSAVTTILFGLAPAARLARRAPAPGARPGLAPAGGERFRGGLAAAQIALALVLLTAAGLLARSFVRLRAVDPGFRPENVVAMTVELSEAAYTGAARMRAFHREVLAGLGNVPGAAEAAAINWLPLGDVHISGDFRIDGRSDAPPFDVYKPAVSPGYFRTMGIRLLGGREFAAADRAPAPGTAIVSRAVAALFGGPEQALGKRVSLRSAPTDRDWLTIVGVVDDVRQHGPAEPQRPAIYQCYLQVEQPFLLTQMTFLVRTRIEPREVIPALSGVLRRVDPDQAATSVALMSDVVAQVTADPAFHARLLGIFASLALALALVGTYGVIAYSVAQRQREIGVRMALGAARHAVLWLVIRRSALVGSSGVVIGTVLAWALTRLLASFLFETDPVDPATFATAAAGVLVAAVLAGAVPARRAARVNPLTALRHE